MEKVVFVNRYFFPDLSATSQLLTDLCTDLSRDGWRVMVVTSRQLYEDAMASLEAEETVSGVQVERVWTTRYGRAGLLGRVVDYVSFYLSAAYSLMRTLRRGDIVVAETDPPLISLVCAGAAWVRGATMLNWIQDVFPEVAERLGVKLIGRNMGRILRRVRNASWRAASLNVVIGERMRDVVLGEGIEESRVRVVPNWADGRTVAPIPRDSNALRAEWDIGRRIVVGYAGNLGRAHGVEAIIEAAAILRERKDIVFLFVGGGAQYERLRQTCRARGLGNVEFRPYQARVRLGEALGVADVHLVALKPDLEGLIVPSKLYGVLAAGRPIVFLGADDGEVARVLAEGGCGVTVGDRDGEMLARTLTEWADDAAKRDAMGRLSRILFEQRFERAEAVRAWTDVLLSSAGSCRVGAHLSRRPRSGRGPLEEKSSGKSS